ncbi:MAG: hypothetical protein P4L53_07015 [Candidatus Obscuribacterales bacterium]|nr:hypothetical protein [Candidatus Obscuribacterales bacterium]
MLVSGVFIVSFLSPAASADTVKTGKLTALEGFVEQTPKFDTHLPDYHFQLGVDQTVLRGSERKNLLHAKAKLKNLRARADQFYLKTTMNDVSLKAQTAAAAHPLQGKVDTNGQPLQAKVAEVPRSPLNTFERDVHAPFQLDLDKLMSKVAPNLVSAMDLEINQAPVRSAESVARQVKELEPQLNSRAPHPALPAVPPSVKVDASLSRALDAETKRSSSVMHDATGNGAGKLQKELEQGARLYADGQKLAGMAGAFVPQIPSSASKISNSNKSAIDQAAREMDAQMARVKKQTSLTSDINAEIRDAKNQLRSTVAVSQSGMDAILTHARNLPQKKLPDLPNAAIQSDVEDVVPWDAWHARFAQLARSPIFKNVSGVKNPSGADTVQITVSSNHSLTVTLIKSSNPFFDNAIISAYKSLNGNPNLEFPKLSRRQSITFLVDNEHKGIGIPTGVQSQPSTGDQEIIRHRI